MKNFNNESASILLLGMMLFGSAQVSAASQNIPLGGVVGLDSISLSARVDDGVAVVYGHVDSGIEEALAINYVEGLEGVDVVLDQVTVR